MELKRKFIELEGTYFEVIQQDIGFTLQKVMAEDFLAVMAESTLLDVNNTENENLLQKSIDNVSKNLQSKVENQLNDLIFNLMGFSHRFSRWEIDHCNGRMGDVARFISDKVKTQITEELDKGVVYITDKERVELHQAMKEDYISTYKEQLRRAMRNNAHKMADEHANELIKKMVEDNFKDKSKYIIDAVLTNKKLP